MQISARNQLKGKIKDIVKGPVNAKILLDVNGLAITSIITAESVNELGLKAGDDVTALIKSSDIILMR